MDAHLQEWTTSVALYQSVRPETGSLGVTVNGTYNNLNKEMQGVATFSLFFFMYVLHHKKRKRKKEHVIIFVQPDNISLHSYDGQNFFSLAGMF